MNIRRSAVALCAAAFAALLAAGNMTAAAQEEVVPLAKVPESADPIILPLYEWTAHHVSQMVTGEILKRMGYNVEYRVTGNMAGNVAITEGEMHVDMEYWVSNNRVKFLKQTHGGGAEDLGHLGLAPGEAWYYPAYMEEECPGLPDWKALNECAEIFAVPETFPKGRFLDYPAEWVAYNDKRIEALELDYVIVPSGGEGSIITEVESAYARKAPLLVVFWEPHWLFSKYDLKKVALPEHKVACEEDPSWGVNPNAVWDCSIPAQEIKKLVWDGLRTKWPAAHRLVRAIQLGNDEQNAMVLEVDVDGADIEEVVTAWVDANESKWQFWVKDALLNPGK